MGVRKETVWKPHKVTWQVLKLRDVCMGDCGAVSTTFICVRRNLTPFLRVGLLIAFKPHPPSSHCAPDPDEPERKPEVPSFGACGRLKPQKRSPRPDHNKTPGLPPCFLLSSPFKCAGDLTSLSPDSPNLQPLGRHWGLPGNPACLCCLRCRPPHWGVPLHPRGGVLMQCGQMQPCAEAHPRWCQDNSSLPSPTETSRHPSSSFLNMLHRATRLFPLYQKKKKGRRRKSLGRSEILKGIEWV